MEGWINVKLRDLIEYLEMKIIDNTAREDEYHLYIEYKKFGEKVFKWNAKICNRLKHEYFQIFEGDND